MTFGARSGQWAAYTLRSEFDVGGTPEISDATGIAGPAGPYWIDPAALARLTAGATLDQDPSTNETITVSGVDQNQGRATLDSEMPGVGVTSTFDLHSGVLVGQESRLAGAGFVIDAQLTASP